MINIVLDISEDVAVYRQNPDLFYEEVSSFIKAVKTTKIDVSVGSNRFSLIEFVIKNNNEKLFNFLIENGEITPSFCIEKDKSGKPTTGYIELNNGYDFDIFAHSDFGKLLFLNALKEWLDDDKNALDKATRAELICSNRIQDFIINSLENFDSFKEYYGFLSDNNLPIIDNYKDRLVSNLTRNQRVDLLSFIMEKNLINIDDILEYSRSWDAKSLLKGVFLTDSLIFERFLKEKPNFILSSIDGRFLEKISSIDHVNCVKGLGYRFNDNLDHIFELEDIVHFKKIVEWTIPKKLLNRNFLNLVFNKFSPEINNNSFIENVDTLIGMDISPDKYDFLKDARDVNMDNIKYLIERGAKIESSALIQRLISNNMVKSLNFLHKNGFNIANADNLYFGLENNVHKETINWFLKKGADIYGETTCNKLAFFGISNKRDLKLIKDYLSASGNNLDFERKSSIGNNFFNDFLYRGVAKHIKYADRFDFDDLMSEIISTKKTIDCSGVDISGNTTLHLFLCGSEKKPYEIFLFKELVSASDIISNFSIKNNEGDTPLHILFKNEANNFIGIAKYILNNMPEKLDLFIKNNEGNTPMDLLLASNISKEDLTPFYNFYLNNKISTSVKKNSLTKI